MDDFNGLFSGEMTIHPEQFAEMYTAVYEQLKKDFHPYSTLHEAPPSLSSQWLFDEVARLLSDLLRNHPSSLQPFLYRVDISESQMRRAMQTSSPDTKLDQLTWMILRREAQKVWIRKHLK